MGRTSTRLDELTIGQRLLFKVVPRGAGRHVDFRTIESSVIGVTTEVLVHLNRADMCSGILRKSNRDSSGKQYQMQR
jgi:hypothetical protein